jgi:hypothetical protein
MSTEVVMPRMGETVDEGTVNAWHSAGSGGNPRNPRVEERAW